MKEISEFKWNKSLSTNSYFYVSNKRRWIYLNTL